MYEQSWESARACVVKHIRARLPSQARRAGLVRVLSVFITDQLHVSVLTGHHQTFNTMF
jgi:hypothetical protein